jgi:asparagine synthase (glutamine-hydrolysing)
MASTLETVDRAGAAFSIEPRFPFWDKRLAEFCLALPPEQKLRNGWNRWVMRRAMNGILPREVQWRGRKTDVHPAFEHGLRAFERERLGEVIMRDGAVVEEYVDLPALREIYRQFVARAAAPDEVNAMWRAACLGLWLRRAGLTLPSMERR